MLAEAVRKTIFQVAAGVRPMRPAQAKPPIEPPADLAAALAAVPAAKAAFNDFPPSAQREYVEWVIEAKQPATRERCVATKVAQCAEGKQRY